jgi:hypothetical protein
MGDGRRYPISSPSIPHFRLEHHNVGVHPAELLQKNPMRPVPHGVREKDDYYQRVLSRWDWKQSEQ